MDLVLQCIGAVKDRHDKLKWHTYRGPISVMDEKFYSWQYCQGGGGAIDLSMFLLNTGFASARAWLVSHFLAESRKVTAVGLYIPEPVRDNRSHVQKYLCLLRRLPERILQPYFDSQIIYGDYKRNAVFLLLGKEKRAVGAELRGTGKRVWRGMSKGSKRHAGFFYCGPTSARRCILCESAIDALSCYVLHPDALCISTAGILARPACISPLIRRGYSVYCGYDKDEAGELAARRMMMLYPSVMRLRPALKDWNEVIMQ
jgi:hypothetical protein